MKVVLIRNCFDIFSVYVWLMCAAQALEIITVDSESKAKQITDRRRRMDELRRAVESEQQHQIVLNKKAAEAAKLEEAVQGTIIPFTWTEEEY